MSFFPSLHATDHASKTTRFRSYKDRDRRSTLRQYADATLGAGSLKQAVKLPKGEKLEEWVAVHVADFYSQINMLYGCITEFCTSTSCPRMQAGEGFEYLWQDGDKYKKPKKVSAPVYVENLMNWIQSYMDNEAVFPSKSGKDFGPDALLVFRNILKRLFRVYAHIYNDHLDQVMSLGVQVHLNTSLKHFVLFTREFDLVDECEFAPLHELIGVLLDEDKVV